MSIVNGIEIDTDLSAYSDKNYQVWVITAEGGKYMYRDDLIFSVARNWADTWNKDRPADVPQGATFIRVVATTSFQAI